MPVLSFLRDIVDANTEEDQRKRLKRGGKRYYKEDKQATGTKDVRDNLVEQVGGKTLSFLRGAKDIAVEGIAKPALRTSAAFSQAAGNIGNKLAGGPTENADQFFGTDITSALDYKGTKRQIAGDVASTVLNFGVPGIGGKIAQSAGKVLPGKIIPRVAGYSAAGAIEGGPSQVAQLVGDEGQELTKENIASAYKTGTEFGAAFGAAIPVAGALAKGTSKQFKSSPITPEQLKARNKLVVSYNLAVDKGKPAIAQKIAKEIDDIDNSTLSPASRQVNKRIPKVSADSPHPYGESIGGYDSADELLKDYADSLKGMDAGVKGGQLIPDGEGGYRRTTEHTPFYSNFYKENKKAPTKADYLAEAERQLESGKDMFGASKDYKALKSRPTAKPAPVTSTTPVSLPAKSEYITTIELDGRKYEMTEDQLLSRLIDEKSVPIAERSITQQDKVKRLESALKDIRSEATQAIPAQQLPAESSKELSFINAPVSSISGESILGGVALKGQPKRGFLTTLQESPNTTPQLKSELSELPQTYTRASEKVAYKNAQRVVDETPRETLLAETLNKETLSRQEGANGLELLSRLQREGSDAAVQLAEHLDTVFRRHGQSSQIAALWDKMTPEGILRLATQKIKKARETQTGGIIKKGFEEEQPTAQGIKSAVEGFSESQAPRVQKTIKETVDSIANEQQALPLEGVPLRSGAVDNTGKKLAKNVEKAATPEIKKKADILVNELTKKVKQEFLEPKKVDKKSPLAILREVFGRNAEAQEAYPLAQQILRDKYKNSPTMQKILDKFFASELNLPVASSTIDSAIKDQLKENSVRISDAIYTSWAAQKQSVSDVADALVKEGFDKESAQKLAKEVTARLNKQFAEAKTKTLERLAADAPEKVKQTYLDKIAKLSNIGALDEQDYIDIARKELKLPSLSSETAKEISELAQEMQSLPEGYEKFQLIKKIQEKINAEIPISAGERAKQILASSKSALASYDISGGGRQGSVLGSRFPKVFAKAEKKSLSYLKSEETYDRAMAEHATSKNADIYEDWGIDWAHPTRDFSEEAFNSSLPEKVPLLGRGVSASNRAYTGVLSDIRLGAADNIIKQFEDAGIDVRQWPESWKKSMGQYINTASGRGQGKPGGLFEKWAPFLNDTIFSPKLWKSRLDMLNPLYYARLKGPARKYAIQSAASFAGIASAILGLAVLAGAEVETDARSSDFLKVKVGDNRYDVLSGFQQNLVFAHRQLSGEKKSSQSGKITDLDSGGFGVADRISILGDLIESKSNPVFGLAKAQITGKDNLGNELDSPLSRFSNFSKSVTPLSVQDTFKNIQDSGPIGALKSVPGYVGIGSQTYGVQDISLGKGQKEIISKAKAEGASDVTIEASTRFFQNLKVGASNRQKVSDQINEAISKNDLEKAQEIASKYNDSLKSTFKKWREKYPEYIDDPYLAEEYRAAKIILNRENLAKRQYNLKKKAKAGIIPR